MKIQLSDHFTTGKLLRFVAPSIVMMIFTSVYGVVDGLFVSNFVGKTAFAAVNLIFPLLMILGALGFMIGTGGSALVARTLGEGDSGRAQRYFSMLVYVTIGGGIVFSVLGLLFLRPIAVLLGAQGAMLEDCVVYGGILLAGQTMFMLQNVFQSFLITAEKPHFGLGVTVAAGLTNIILDFLFIAVFRWGVAGAAIATAASQFVGGGVPLLYFARPNRSLLRLGKTKLDSRALLKACTNGSSELMTNLSSSLVTVLYNFQLMQLAGEDGIAAYGVIMYVNFIFIAIFIGYSIGSAPVVGYHHGAGNSTELKSLFRKSLLLVGAAGVALTVAAEALALPLTKIFVGYDAALLAMTCRLSFVFAFVPAHRLQHFQLRLLYSAERRLCFRRYLVPAHAGVPDSRGSGAARSHGDGRHLARHRCGRTSGSGGERLVSVAKKGKIPLCLNGAASNHILVGGLGLGRQICQRDAVQIILHQRVQLPPHGQRVAFGPARTFHRLLFQAGHGGQAALRKPQNASHGILLGRPCQPVAPALSAHACQKLALHQTFENALQIFFRDILTPGNSFERDISLCLVLGQVNHNTQRIAPLGGHHHTAVPPFLFVSSAAGPFPRPFYCSAIKSLSY